jgi:hypothetical protein
VQATIRRLDLLASASLNPINSENPKLMNVSRRGGSALAALLLRAGGAGGSSNLLHAADRVVGGGIVAEHPQSLLRSGAAMATALNPRAWLHGSTTLPAALTVTVRPLPITSTYTICSFAALVHTTTNRPLTTQTHMHLLDVLRVHACAHASCIAAGAPAWGIHHRWCNCHAAEASGGQGCRR